MFLCLQRVYVRVTFVVVWILGEKININKHFRQTTLVLAALGSRVCTQALGDPGKSTPFLVN